MRRLSALLRDDLGSLSDADDTITRKTSLLIDGEAIGALNDARCSLSNEEE